MFKKSGINAKPLVPLFFIFMMKADSNCFAFMYCRARASIQGGYGISIELWPLYIGVPYFMDSIAVVP